MATQQPDLQFLNTPDHHKIAYAVIGNPELIPILFLHGGPGGNANPNDAAKFNLERHCVIMFDQRGCGRSTPTGDITNNTTQHLLNDIEQLRQTLKIKQWIVYGGSWGATLALEYAKQHPTQVMSIILRGSFLARQQDLNWFIQPDGVAKKYPAAYAKLLKQLNPSEGEALTSRLYQILKPSHTDAARTEFPQKTELPQSKGLLSRMLNPAPLTSRKTKTTVPYEAALAWDNWEAAVMGFPALTAETNSGQQHKRIAAKLVYAHYCHNQFFLDGHGVMRNPDQLNSIPVTLIHGKNDQVCPLSAAKELDAALPNSRLIVVDAGHTLHEKNIAQALWQVVSE